MGQSGFDDLESDRGQAYLGYSNLAFGMLRLLEPNSSIASLHDRVTAGEPRAATPKQNDPFESHAEGLFARSGREPQARRDARRDVDLENSRHTVSAQRLE